MHKVLFDLYLIVLLTACVCGILKFQHLDTAAKILCGVMVLDLITEIVAYYAARIYHNNIPVLNVSNVFEFTLESFYFNFSIDTFKKYHLGIYIGITGLVTGLIDIRYQSLKILDTYFLLFAGIAIITMSLFSFALLVVKQDDLDLKHYPHFWFAACLTVYWAFTFFLWGLYDFFKNTPRVTLLTDCVDLPVNILTYACLAIIFLWFPKMCKDE